MSSFNGTEIDEPDKIERMECTMLVYRTEREGFWAEVPVLTPMDAMLLVGMIAVLGTAAIVLRRRD